jgi:hypothetical protein
LAACTSSGSRPNPGYPITGVVVVTSVISPRPADKDVDRRGFFTAVMGRRRRRVQLRERLRREERFSNFIVNRTERACGGWRPGTAKANQTALHLWR